MILKSLTATRYLQPLREGGSLPAVVETEDGGLYVMKFRGAGQGARALVAEIIFGLIAREAGFAVPELATVQLTADFGRAERDPEIQDLLRASEGLNFGIQYLDGALNFSPAAAGHLVTDEFASRLVWLDALLTNPDRTHRNPNLLVWQGDVWLIDHGAALYFHHDWAGVTEERMRARFPLIRDHVLLDRASDMRRADADLAPLFTEGLLRSVLEAVPGAFLTPEAVVPGEPSSPDEARARYLEYFVSRLTSPRGFVDEAVEARETLLRQPPLRRHARR